jgi:Papain fold toxin 2
MTASAQEVAAQAARGFDRLQCQECAEAVRAALLAAGHTGQLIEIRARGKRDYMVCISFEEGRRSITQNGRHLGVRVGDLVFDNLHPLGLLYEAWLRDFDAPAGIEVHSTVDF